MERRDGQNKAEGLAGRGLLRSGFPDVALGTDNVRSGGKEGEKLEGAEVGKGIMHASEE